MPRQRLYDTEFVVRFRMALQHAGINWRSPQAVGEFFDKSRQTAHQWLNGTVPDGRRELWEVTDRLKVSARWLATGEDSETPEWVRYMNHDAFRDGSPDEPAPKLFPVTTRRQKKSPAKSAKRGE